ncbi:hypothetical protein [Psychroserpens sp.]|uniref:hypothetical protein n=1 Tax=Psychroserpens sp. TaxID=2020870 RepID=UPI003859F86C
MKLYITILLIFTLFTSINAQNSDLAKAYYEKAQTSLENKNYEETLNYIEKSKENAGGTNPDIIYVELKTRYYIDSNINKTKSLINQFLKDAFEDDDRRSEVSKIFIDIESSDNFYPNGLRKQIEYIDSIYKVRKSYSEQGSMLSKELFKKDGDLIETHYFVNENTLILIEKSRLVLVMNNDGKRIQEYQVDKDNSIMNFVTYQYFNNIKDFEYDILQTNGSGTKITIEDLSSKVSISNLIPRHKNLGFELGVVRQLYVLHSSYNNSKRYYFDNDGEQFKSKHYKRGKLKYTYLYKNGKWEKVKE